MVNKKLSKWIKSGEKRGYSKKQLKGHLIKHGYKKKEIDKAIFSLKSKKKIKFNFKEFIRPSFLKLFFPILLLILIMVSFLINSIYFPSAGELTDDIYKHIEDVIKTRSENNVDPDKVIDLIKQTEMLQNRFTIESATYMRLLILGNIYIPTQIYKLNPFFPIPCEASLFENYNNFRCSYYIDEKNYNNIKDYQKRNQVVLLKNIPNYNKINLIDLLINSLILSFEVYLIICLISFGFNIIKQKDKKLKLILSAILILLPGAIFFFSGKLYSLFLYPFVILFVILIFIKKESVQKIILYSSLGLFVILLVSGLIIGNWFIEKETFKLPRNREYNAIYCENTKILNQTEKQLIISSFNQEYKDEDWNICSDPSCYELCSEYCGTNLQIGVIELRGDKPSCICGCS